MFLSLLSYYLFLYCLCVYFHVLFGVIMLYRVTGGFAFVGSQVVIYNFHGRVVRVASRVC